MRRAGGSGLLAIWCAASVMPYASMSGALKTASSSAMTCGGIDDDDERTKRNGLSRITSALPAARERMVWCIVGTAVYQLGLHSFIQPKNLSALNPGVTKIWLPTAMGASTPAIRPWMWKSGMMCSSTSSSVSCKVRLMLRADAHTFRCDSGTILGRDVVPDVCKINATSSACAGPPCAAGAVCADAAARSSKSPAPRSGWGTSSITAMPSLAATARAGVSAPCATINALALRSLR